MNVRTPKITIVKSLSSLQYSRFIAGPKGIVISIPDPGEFKLDFLDSGLAVNLAQSGFVLFALIGLNSEEEHDALDWELESKGFIKTVTTWHNDDTPNEVASYLVSMAVTSDLSQLVVILNDLLEFDQELLKEIEKLF